MQPSKIQNLRNRNVTSDQERRITFLSPDRQVEIAVVSEGGLKRWPPHDGRVAVMRLQPQPNTRIRSLDDGRLEVVFRHSEVLGLLFALNASERHGFVYELPKKVMHKSAETRRYWEKINEARIRRLMHR
jgi:hypothetical protein